MSLLGLLGRGFHQNDVLAVEVINEIVDPQQTSITGCISPKKERSVIMTADTVTAFRWGFYDGAGNAVQPLVEDELLDNSLDQTNFPARLALFYDPFQACEGVHVGKIVYNEDDGLTILPPQIVRGTPGVYLFEVYWIQPEDENGGRKQLFGKGLISVEESALRQYSLLADPKSHVGPLSLSEVRTHLRDYTEDNDTLGRAQFTDQEILEAIVHPVRIWNETLPPTSRYSAANFPYRAQWLKATVAKLCQTEALWMLRNQLPIQAEGVTVDDRNKWMAYMKMAKEDMTEYETFVRATKQVENIRRGFAII